MEAKDRIIVALDVDSLDKAKSLVESLAPHVGCFKVGLELLTAVGAPKVVEFVHSLGGQIFYDGKFNDIPNTVGGAAKAVAGLNVKMFNVHASAGRKAVEAAVTNKGSSLVLGVTILTSIDEEECVSIFGGKPGAKVLQFSRMLKEVGADGIICSPQELELLGKQKELDSLLKITPGVRPEWAAAGDQKRIMTPAEAIKAGATALVIGRPITKPPAEIGTPADAAKKIAEEISEILEWLKKDARCHDYELHYRGPYDLDVGPAHGDYHELNWQDCSCIIRAENDEEAWKITMQFLEDEVGRVYSEGAWHNRKLIKLTKIIGNQEVKP